MMKNHERKIFGNETRRQDFGNFVLVESVYPARSRMPRHTHEIAHVSFVLQGSFTESCGRRQRASEPSALIIHPPDEDHSVAFHKAGARVFSFHIKPRLHERIGDIITAINDKPTTTLTLEQIRQMFRRTKQTYKLSVKRDESLSEITLKTRRIV